MSYLLWLKSLHVPVPQYVQWGLLERLMIGFDAIAVCQDGYSAPSPLFSACLSRLILDPPNPPQFKSFPSSPKIFWIFLIKIHLLCTWVRYQKPSRSKKIGCRQWPLQSLNKMNFSIWWQTEKWYSRTIEITKLLGFALTVMKYKSLTQFLWIKIFLLFVHLIKSRRTF